MACLYCGKEIGAIRQIRDSEFCSAAHRKQYGERLSRALGNIGAPEPPPAGIAGFRSDFPVQTGRVTMLPASDAMPHRHTARTGNEWPVNVAPPLGSNFRTPAQEAVPSTGFTPAPASLDLPARIRMPRPRFSGPPKPAIPAAYDTPLPAPAPQAAERWIASATAPAVPMLVASLRPSLGMVERPAPAIPAAYGTPLPASAPQAERWIATPTAAAVPMALASPRPRVALPERPAPAIPAAYDTPLATPAPQAAERWIGIASAPAIPIEIRFRQPRIGALPVARTFVRRVETIAQSLEAEPVARDVRAVMDPRPAAYYRPAAMLRFALHAIDELAAQPSPQVQAPPPTGARPGLQPMAVEAMPSVPAHVPAPMAMAPDVTMPHIRAIVAQVLPQARAVAGPAPIPVESLPSTAFEVAALDARPALRFPTLAHFQPAEDAAELLAAPVPAAGPAPVEAMPSAPAFAALPSPLVPALVAQPFYPEIRTRFDMPAASALLPAIAEPLPAAPQAAMLEPISRLAAQPAGKQPERPAPAIPTPGPFALEYYCQGIASTPSKRIEPIASAVAIVLQPFAVPASLGKLDALLKKKPSRIVLPFEEIFARKPEPEAQPKKRAGINTYGKIAAAVMVGIALYGGSRIANLSHRTEEFRAQVAASERTVTVAEARGADPTQANFGNGPVGKMRRAIANRAATEITDTFKAGMKAWGAEQQSWAPGWRHHAQGYVTTGAMALFQPSLKYTDYRMEFYGQIEEKSIGWVVRAHDKKNYYAMKFTVIEPGLRPIIAMEHYSVVNGKAGKKATTPLSVMVHNNRPIQVALDVRGNHFTASIDGERIESWTDEAAAEGGVGFFSDPGEKARLYWMKLSRNQDALGRFCAYLSGGSKQTAEVRSPRSPNNGPEPISPRLPALALAAAGPWKIRKHRRSEAWTD